MRSGLKLTAKAPSTWFDLSCSRQRFHGMLWKSKRTPVRLLTSASSSKFSPPPSSVRQGGTSWRSKHRVTPPGAAAWAGASMHQAARTGTTSSWMRMPGKCG